MVDITRLEDRSNETQIKRRLEGSQVEFQVKIAYSSTLSTGRVPMSDRLENRRDL